MSTPDYYEILGVDRNADASTIKKAFRQKARTAHPDAGGDEEEFKKLSEAYEVLSDPEKKKVYDNFGSTGPYIPPDGNYSTSTRYTTNFSGINWEDILNNMRGGSWSTNTTTTGFSFDDLFGANRQDRSTTQAQSTVSLDVETNLNVSLADTVNGGKKRISVHIDGKKKTFDINVPKQHSAEPTIRLAGQGRTNSQGITGDLFIHIHTEIPDGYTIEGKNIVGTIDIPFPVAVCGGKVQATLPSGKEVKVKVPPHTDSNKTFSFSKEGIEEGGKTVLATRITIPDNLTPREVLQIKKMKDEHDL